MAHQMSAMLDADWLMSPMSKMMPVDVHVVVVVLDCDCSFFAVRDVRGQRCARAT